MSYKLCPFCGGNATLSGYWKPDGDYCVYVRCRKCGATGEGFIMDESLEDLADNNEACDRAGQAWNTRTDDD